MIEIKLSEIELRAIKAAMSGDLSDPVELMHSAGCDVSVFFEFGDWRNVDFTKSNLKGVSFRGADMRGVVILPEQYSIIASSKPRFLPDTPDVEQDLEDNADALSSGYDVLVHKDATQSNAIVVEDLICLVRHYNPETNAELIEEAYNYCVEMHEGQQRHSGKPYFTHPVAVAAILTEQRLDDAIIITALLHDTIEYTKASYRIIEDRFGQEVADLVDGVTKLNNLQLSNTETKQAEKFRKLFMTISKDLRVILVKLADRLHNMRTIKAMRPDKQAQKARETMDIYAPLAGRMGIQWMREELEDLAFRVLNPDARASIIRRFITLQREAGDVVERITGDMRRELEKAGIDAEVYGRGKKPYSIWRKMQEKDLGFFRLSEAYCFRIIPESQDECYLTLNTIHQRWRAVPGGFKDYISQPKSNGYRSIHTTVSGRDGKRVEVQIRTRAMHEVAETGVAAHWSYRDGVRAENPFAVDPAKWLTSVTEQFDAEEDHEDVLEAVKLEMYADKVFCFTPKGDVIKLPRGATPIDFAYAIHTCIGHATVSAKVDGMRVPLWTRLKNGQSVEVITADGQTPQATWLDIATTGKARAAIRRALREFDRGLYVKLGRKLARSAFEHVGKKATDKALETAARTLGLKDADEVCARMGSAELTARQVLNAVYLDLAPEAADEVAAERAVIGLSADQNFERARCCQPLPGERIVGITYRGRGVVIHAIDCEILSQFDGQPDRWLDLNWRDGTHACVYSATLDITITQTNSAMGKIFSLIGEHGAGFSNTAVLDRKPDFNRILVEIEVQDTSQLYNLMVSLESENDVLAVNRHRNLDG